MAKYIAVIHKEADSEYGVSFPDFPGCISAGATMQEAYNMGREALRGHIDVMIEHGDALPETAMTLDEAGVHESADDALAFFVVDMHVPSKPERVNITVDSDLLQMIDAASPNRSAFFSDAARTILDAGIKPAMKMKVRGNLPRDSSVTFKRIPGGSKTLARKLAQKQLSQE